MKRARLSPRPIEWSPDAAARLKPSMNSDDAEVEAEVQSGQAQLLEWGRGELLTVVRVEGDEFVYCCVAGRRLPYWIGPGVDYARRLGCKTIRMHTVRPGIVKMVRHLSPVQIEPGVYRMAI